MIKAEYLSELASCQSRVLHSFLHHNIHLRFPKKCTLGNHVRAIKVRYSVPCQPYDPEKMVGNVNLSTNSNSCKFLQVQTHPLSLPLRPFSRTTILSWLRDSRKPSLLPLPLPTYYPTFKPLLTREVILKSHESIISLGIKMSNLSEFFSRPTPIGGP